MPEQNLLYPLILSWTKCVPYPFSSHPYVKRGDLFHNHRLCLRGFPTGMGRLPTSRSFPCHCRLYLRSRFPVLPWLRLIVPSLSLSVFLAHPIHLNPRDSLTFIEVNLILVTSNMRLTVYRNTLLGPWFVHKIYVTVCNSRQQECSVGTIIFDDCLYILFKEDTVYVTIVKC